MFADVEMKLRALGRLSGTVGRTSALPCKLCGRPAPFYDIVDFHKVASESNFYPFGPSGIPVSFHRCMGCGLLFTAFFDDWKPIDFQRYVYNDDYTILDPDYVDARPRREAEHIAGLLHGLSGIRLLDYGSGNGVFAKCMAARGFTRVEEYDPFSHPTRPTGRFDVILCNEVLEHSPDPLGTMRDMRELLDDDGCIILGEALQPADVEKIRANWWYCAPRNGHCTTFAERTLSLLARKVDLLFHRGGVLIFRPIGASTGREVCRRVNSSEPFQSFTLEVPASGVHAPLHDTELAYGLPFRWTAQSRLAWNLDVRCDATTTLQVRIPFLMEIESGFGDKSEVLVKGTRARVTTDGMAIVAELDGVIPGVTPIVLQTPEPRSPADLGRAVGDNRKLGIALLASEERGSGGAPHIGPTATRRAARMGTHITEVEFNNGLCTICTEDGQIRAVLLDGHPATLPPGWTPTIMYSGFFPVHLLELRHESGAESTWFLDESLCRIAYDHPSSLPPALAEVVRQRGYAVLRAVWIQLFCTTDLALEPEVQAFFRLGVVIRRRLAEFCAPSMSLQPLFLDLEPLRGTHSHLQLTSSLKLDIDKLLEIVAPDNENFDEYHLDQCMSQIPMGVLSWESPTGSGTSSTNSGLWIDDFLFAYRLVDTVHGCVCYILTAGNPRCVVGVYYPLHNQLFGIRRVYDQLVGSRYGVSLDTLIIHHLAEYGDEILCCWRAPTRIFAAFFAQRLMGMQLWVDLTAVDRMVRSLRPYQIPEIVTVWLPAEIYGPIELLFPEVTGRVNRAASGYHREFIGYAYRERRCLLSPTSNYVTRELSGRIMRVNLAQPSLNQEQERLQAIKAHGGPIVLLGLRVENRTLVNLLEFCVSVIGYLLQMAGRATVIIDGHNSIEESGTSEMYASEQQQNAIEDPVVVERRIVSALKARFSGLPVILIDNIGASVAHSLFWCHHSDFFVTPYGTGLAKYCWACNKTGLIVTSRWTLRNQGHLHIYEDQYVQDPSPIRFLPEEYVEDVPDAPLLVPHQGDPPSRWNFRIREEGLFAELGYFLASTGHDRKSGQ